MRCLATVPGGYALRMPAIPALDLSALYARVQTPVLVASTRAPAPVANPLVRVERFASTHQRIVAEPRLHSTIATFLKEHPC
jgi:hypothetical protein